MPTIVTYTDRKLAANRYPKRIVSPCRPAPCCFSDMEEVGSARQEGRWVYQYRRCRECGFAVRVILREIPDAVRLEQLRQILARAFVRNVPDL
jgi:hypothetical protein